MAKYIGLDGFKRGWVAAWIDDDGNHDFSYSANLTELLSGSFKRAMIDVPVGLPYAGYRNCDRQAKKLVGSAVFLGARRDVWEFESYSRANETYWSTEGFGRGISKQLWGIREKLREMDGFISPELQSKIVETHPELVFWKLAGRRFLARKKSVEGRNQRIEILRSMGFKSISQLLDRRKGSGIAKDDLIDACACAVAARDASEVLGGDLDPRGLRMEMHF